MLLSRCPGLAVCCDLRSGLSPPLRNDVSPCAATKRGIEMVGDLASDASPRSTLNIASC